MPTDRNNQNLKRICSALRLDRGDIVEIMACGGIQISASKAHGWLRGKHAKREHRDSRDGAIFTDHRMKVMTNEEFDFFCSGLVEWFKRRDE